MIRIAAVGEAMLELTHRDDSTLGLGYAGDTLNTATYLSRLTGETARVDYVTRVGTDWYSDQLLSRLEAEGIGTTLIERVDGATPGLYLVRTDATGERSFTYHRSSSPARGLFNPGYGTAVDQTLSGYDAVYLSAITLQILSPGARKRLWTILDAVRQQSGTVIFDTNYRPSGWESPQEARTAIETTLRRTDIALPTFDDERALFGDPDPCACARRIAEMGVPEIVVKDGAEGCLVFTSTRRQSIAASSVSNVVDSTGAGDSFNAGYLAARFAGEDPAKAARAGHRLAAEVIRWPGAIVPQENFSPRAETSRVPA